MRYSRPGMPPVDTEVLERPALTAEEAQAIAEATPGIEIIPNLTPSPAPTIKPSIKRKK